jgi:hypothetical protein
VQAKHVSIVIKRAWNIKNYGYVGDVSSIKHQIYITSRWKEDKDGEGVDEALKLMEATLRLWWR